MQLPRLGLMLMAMSFSGLIGSLQYRRDLTLSVRESLVPWVLCVLWSAALLFWAFSVTDAAPAVVARTFFAIGLAAATSLICLVPLRWVISGFGASRYAP